MLAAIERRPLKLIISHRAFMDNSSAQYPAKQALSGIIRRDAVEDMGGAVKNFFNLDALQLEPGPFCCQIDFIAAGNTFVYREHYPLRTHLSGELLHGRFGFAIPEHGPNLKFSGEEMDHCRLASAISGEEMDVYAPGGLQQFVVLLDHGRLLRLAEATGLNREALAALRQGRSAMPLVTKPHAVKAFGSKVRSFLAEAASGKLAVDAEAFEDWVYAEALSIMDVNDVPCGRPSAAVVVQRAIEVADRWRGPLRMASLCEAMNISLTGLEVSFRKVTGLTPHAYFLRRRLNRARAELLSLDPLEGKVTEVALGQGFTELGRFAVRYRELFGELPSQTLRRAERGRVRVGFGGR